jgi:hypothetical protein
MYTIKGVTICNLKITFCQANVMLNYIMCLKVTVVSGYEPVTEEVPLLSKNENILHQ